VKSLDATDQRLLRLLQSNSRQPLVALARAVGLSRSATQERLRRLEGTGVIAGYTIRLGEAPPSGVRAWLSLRFEPGYRCADAVPNLRSFPQIRLLDSLTGPVDLAALVEASDVGELAALRERIMAIRGIAEVETALVLETHVERR
jgi:DNA-binding Lrp family transcriptional regulator